MTHLAERDTAAGAPRRSARAAALVLALGIALGLVGCSAGASTGGDAGGGAGADEAPAPEEQVEEDRAVVIEGTMAIRVDDAEAATAETIRIVAASDGRVDGREEWRDEDGDSATTTMVLRIPADSLDAAIERLRELGTVESLQTSKTDVTSDVQDVDAHVAALESTITRLTSFQDEATSVTDLLSIEKEIASRQAELEGYLTQQAALAERVALSTLTVSLSSAVGPAAAPDSFWSALGVGWNSFTAFLAGAAIALGVLLPWLLAIGLVTGAIILLVRWIRRRRPPRPPVVPPPGPGAAWFQQEQPVAMPPAPPTP